MSESSESKSGAERATALAPRLQRLPRTEVLGRSVPVATGWRARLLGLARLHPVESGAGLLIPRCRSVHAFAMRFALDVYFLDRSGEVVASRAGLAPRRVAFERRACAVLERSAEGR